MRPISVSTTDSVVSPVPTDIVLEEPSCSRDITPHTITEDKSLNMCSADLAAVVENVTSGRNQNLSGIKRVQINLRVSKGNKDLVLLCSCTDTVHLRAVTGKTVLTILLQQRQGLLVVDAPHPVRVARDPCVITWSDNEATR